MTVSLYIHDLLVLVSHLLPVAITLFFVLAIVLLRAFLHQFKYISLVTDAVTDSDIISLAKHMAKRNGGKYIDTDDLWEAFVPAAKAVVLAYNDKKTT